MAVLEKKQALLKRLHRRKAQLAIKLDLSIRPEIFKQRLKVTGIYLYGRAFSEESKQLSEIELDIIAYNEIDLTQITPPEDHLIFRLRDLQEFPYSAAVQVSLPEKN